MANSNVKRAIEANKKRLLECVDNELKRLKKQLKAEDYKWARRSSDLIKRYLQSIIEEKIYQSIWETQDAALARVSHGNKVTNCKFCRKKLVSANKSKFSCNLCVNCAGLLHGAV